MIIAQGGVQRNLKLIASESRAMVFILIAAVSGPVIGASLILVSLQFTSVGVSSTLANTTPIILIPIGYFHLLKKKITVSRYCRHIDCDCGYCRVVHLASITKPAYQKFGIFGDSCSRHVGRIIVRLSCANGGYRWTSRLVKLLHYWRRLALA